MRAAKVRASLRIRAVSPEPSLLAHTSSESRGTFRQKATSLAPLNGWACAVKVCHDGMLEDTNSLDGAHMADVNSYERDSLNVTPTLNQMLEIKRYARKICHGCLVQIEKSVPLDHCLAPPGEAW